MIKRMHCVGKRRKTDGMIMHIFGVFNTSEDAYKFAANANRWYGEEHPLTPLTVISSDVLVNPPLFPEMDR